MFSILDVPRIGVKESGIVEKKHHQYCQHPQPVDVISAFFHGFSCSPTVNFLTLFGEKHMTKQKALYSEI